MPLRKLGAKSTLKARLRFKYSIIQEIIVNVFFFSCFSKCNPVDILFQAIELFINAEELNVRLKLINYGLIVLTSLNDSATYLEALSTQLHLFAFFFALNQR